MKRGILASLAIAALMFLAMRELPPEQRSQVGNAVPQGEWTR